jgi:hypothetical protein
LSCLSGSILNDQTSFQGTDAAKPLTCQTPDLAKSPGKGNGCPSNDQDLPGSVFHKWNPRRSANLGVRRPSPHSSFLSVGKVTSARQSSSAPALHSSERKNCSGSHRFCISCVFMLASASSMSSPLVGPSLLEIKPQGSLVP